MSTVSKLGPFIMEEEIGEGGMGSVWRAIHSDTGVPVAVKLIRGAADHKMRRQFQREVQAHAALGHPGIVYLFDYGRIDDSLATAERLRPGNPYVAMELADRGTVRDARPINDWATARAIVVQVLDALAYAHARGVIHRDLKPENLLCFDAGDDSGAATIKLADFGIAHALGSEHETDVEELEVTAGTPLYMSPEQLSGHWRAYGPWTDLYALGCIIWELVCGRPPFDGASPLAVAMKHGTEARPPLQPRFAIPDGLQDWIHQAMAIDHQRRFRRAADALWALPGDLTAGAFSTTPGAVDGAVNDSGPTIDMSRTAYPVTLASTLLDDARDLALAETMDADSSAVSAAGATIEDAPPSLVAAVESTATAAQPTPQNASTFPPVPHHWRPDTIEPLPAPLVGTGLGLFGLREPPFVNRSDECEQIWKALRRVVNNGDPQMVVLSGDAGTGKSRIAEWLTIRAHEVGAATILRAVHTRSGGFTDGLRAAFEQIFRTAKMSRSEVYDRLCDELASMDCDNVTDKLRDARALTEYLRPTDEDADDVEGPRYQFADAAQRRILITKILRHLAKTRPLVLWLDDLQWGSETLSLLEHFQQYSDDLPAMLIVATLRSDIVADRPRLQARIETLEDTDWSGRVVVAPLSRSHQRQLLEGLLPLEADLADHLARRTEGHPLFAMQLLGHWIERDNITSGPEGFQVPDDRDVELPATIHDLWMARIDGLARRYPDESGPEIVEALELAAALGREVVEEEWHALLCDAGVNAPDDLVDHLVARGLVRRTKEGWSFAHGLLVESVRRHADEHHRWRRHHRRCARMLADDDGGTLGANAPRVARHLLDAGDDAQALDPLLDALRHFRIVLDTEEWHRYDDLYRTVLQRLAIGDDDRRTVLRDLEYARLLERETRLDDAHQWLERCQSRCRRRGWDDLLARTLLGLAEIAQSRSRLEEAETYIREALTLFRSLGDAMGVGRSLDTLGWIDKWKGDFDAARRHFEKAEAIIRELDSPNEYASVLFGLAAIYSDTEHYQRSIDYTRRARQLYETQGNLRGVSNCLNHLGVTYFFQDDYDQAVQYFEEVVELDDRLGLDRKMLPYYNAGVVNVFRGEYGVAHSYLEEAIRRAGTDDRPGWIAMAHSGMVACAAGMGRFESFDDHLREAEYHLSRTAMVNPSIAQNLELAAEQARRAGHPERALRALTMALAQWEQLEDDEAIERIEAMMAD